ncbi:mitogen-activated protein kinase kinase 4 [Cricetulus griseus]
MVTLSPGKRKALKLNFANPPVKSTARFTLHPNTTGVQNPHIERLRTHSIESSGKLKISPEQHWDFTAEDLKDLGEIGRGAYGSVNKMVHKPSGQIMAVKRIRSTVDEKEQKQLLMDLDVVMRSSDCPYIVQFYGALFREGDCWICMELMSTSFDKFYKYVYSVLDDVIPEEILGKITLAPERIDPSASRQGYDVRSDVWSLGITLYELATGRFPYPKWNSVFDQLTQVVKGDPPQLSNSEEREFSPSFINFVNLCLTKDESKRPKYKELLFSLEQPGLASHFLGPNLLLSFSLYHFMTSISKLVGSVLKKSGLYQLLSTSTAPTLVYATVIGAIGNLGDYLFRPLESSAKFHPQVQEVHVLFLFDILCHTRAPDEASPFLSNLIPEGSQILSVPNSGCHFSSGLQ